MRIRSLTLAAAALATALPALAVADPLDDAIKARKGYYQLLGHNAGMLFGMAKGEIAYDAATASAHAGNLRALAALDTGSMWPAGSDNVAKAGQTRALPVLWETFPSVMDKHTDFTNAANTLAANAGNGLNALRANIGALGNSCGACHDTYRAKNF